MLYTGRKEILKFIPSEFNHSKIYELKPGDWDYTNRKLFGKTHSVCGKNHCLLVIANKNRCNKSFYCNETREVSNKCVLCRIASPIGWHCNHLVLGLELCLLRDLIVKNYTNIWLCGTDCYFPDMLLHKWSVFNLHTVTIVLLLLLFTALHSFCLLWGFLSTKDFSYVYFLYYSDEYWQPIADLYQTFLI